MVFSLLKAEKIPKPRVSLHLVLALVPFLPPRSSFSFLISSLCSSSPLILFVRESSEAFFFFFTRLFSVQGGELEDGDVFTLKSNEGKQPRNK